MKKYFSHDHGARHDKKVVALVSKYKSAGYGIFWATNEMMHEEGGELELDNLTYEAISKQLNEDCALVEAVIKDCINIFKLYFLSGEKMTSNRVKKNLTEIGDKKQVKIEAGRLGGIKSGESRRSKQNEATLEANEAMLEGTNQIKLNKTKLKETIKEDIEPQFPIKRNPRNFPIASEIGDFPQTQFHTIILSVRNSQGINIPEIKVVDLWENFKGVNVDGKTFYQDIEDIYKHFKRWAPKQKIHNGNSVIPMQDKIPANLKKLNS